MLHASVRPLLALLLCAAPFAPVVSAQTIPMLARLDGLQEVPANLSPATGLGFCAFDLATSTLTYREVYQNLSAGETAAHIHGFSGPGVNSGVQHAQALGALKCGAWAVPLAQQAAVLAGNSYFNVHSTAFPGGEIRGQIDTFPNQPTFCYGDGSGTACPCVNNSAAGDNEGCLHAPGIGGRLVGYGIPGLPLSISNDRFVLHALRLPASTFVLFFQGTAPMAGGAGIQFGNGLLCVTGTITRLAIKATCNGQAGLPEPGDLPISVSGGVTPGSYYYQGWYRTFPAFCTAILQNFNTTNGVMVQWGP
ncbi:MAG: CHRD domain-containing protein [Planctomycetes bacterium]|nr:CHRD domain-containing protein [Planctomycetota bacterium]